MHEEFESADRMENCRRCHTKFNSNSELLCKLPARRREALASTMPRYAIGRLGKSAVTQKYNGKSQEATHAELQLRLATSQKVVKARYYY